MIVCIHSTVLWRRVRGMVAYLCTLSSHHTCMHLHTYIYIYIYVVGILRMPYVTPCQSAVLRLSSMDVQGLGLRVWDSGQSLGVGGFRFQGFSMDPGVYSIRGLYRYL